MEHMAHKESHKKLLEVIAAVIAITIVLAYGVFIHLRDHNGIRNVCKRTPDVCVPIEYPGKVSK